MPRYLAVVEYDGSGFQGSQIQARGRTVQGEIQRALQALTGALLTVDMAGRTDRGVHARGQVAAFHLERGLETDRLASALNGIMARDVSVREVWPAPDDFEPRRWAVRRRYRYTILNRKQRCALLERSAYHVPDELDVAAMSQAAAMLVGRHDFRAFGRAPQGDNTIRELVRLEVCRAGDSIVITAEADAFLRRMVRMLTGALVDVGRGKKPAGDLRESLRTGAQEPVSAAAPAKGLTLEAVAYDRQRLGRGLGLWWSCEPLAAAGAKP